MTEKLKHIIIQSLNSEYPDLEQFETELYPNYIFFMKNGKIIFNYNKNNGDVRISYPKIWSFLESFFGLEYEEIQDLTKEWVEENYKLRETTTITGNWISHTKVEENYKLRETTTFDLTEETRSIVEENYKLRETTTYAGLETRVKEVVENYKLRATTTCFSFLDFDL